MNKRFIKTPLKGVTVQDTKNVGTRTVNLLMGEHAGEYVRGDIMDANAVIQAFDELKGNVDVNHDTLEELVNEIHTNSSDSKQRDEEEKAARISGDNTNSQAISAEKARAEAAEQTITDAVAAETTRATAKENEIIQSLAGKVNTTTLDNYQKKIEPVVFNPTVDTTTGNGVVLQNLISKLTSMGLLVEQSDEHAKL